MGAKDVKEADETGCGGAACTLAARREYKTPRWVQVWFLRRSRDNWKKKYMALKAEAKRLQNRVNDVTKSRERWRALAEAPAGAGGTGEGGGPPGAALKKGGAGAAGGGAARRG
jgi:hypothetical protein